MKIKRRKTREMRVGDVVIGGGAPVVVQGMTKTRTEDPRATAAQSRRMVKAGCEIVRVAVPHRRALAALHELKNKIAVPIVADVHFSAELALGALEAGADCVRVNPGNIGGAGELRRIARAAAKLGKALRIGVNAGSLDARPARNNKNSAGARLSTPDRASYNDSEKLARSALRGLEIVERAGLRDVKVSIKAFDVSATVDACRRFAAESDAPLHIGVTEAGDSFHGAIRSAVGAALLLAEGIGDTLRVSLTAPPEREIEAAWEILRSLGLRRRGVEIVSCPTCGRCEADVGRIASEIRKKTAGIAIPLRIAVMGCEVNGPGEASTADAGIALDRTGGGTVFLRGERIRRVSRDAAAGALLDLIEKISSTGEI